MSADAIHCPTCGVMRLRPSAHVPSTPWDDQCGCSDLNVCPWHQVRPEEGPVRPSADAMLARAEARRSRAEEQWQDQARRFARAAAQSRRIETLETRLASVLRLVSPAEGEAVMVRPRGRIWSRRRAP